MNREIIIRGHDVADIKIEDLKSGPELVPVNNIRRCTSTRGSRLRISVVYRGYRETLGNNKKS